MHYSLKKYDLREHITSSLISQATYDALKHVVYTCIQGHDLALRCRTNLYADDIVLIAESAEQLQEMLDCTSQNQTRWQFRFNTKAGN